MVTSGNPHPNLLVTHSYWGGKVLIVKERNTGSEPRQRNIFVCLLSYNLNYSKLFIQLFYPLPLNSQIQGIIFNAVKLDLLCLYVIYCISLANVLDRENCCEVRPMQTKLSFRGECMQLTNIMYWEEVMLRHHGGWGCGVETTHRNMIRICVRGSRSSKKRENI